MTHVSNTDSTIRLSTNGTSKAEYQVGDQVIFFLLSSEEAIRAMGKKKKHMIQFTGPEEIVEVLSPNNTTFRILYKGV